MSILYASIYSNFYQKVQDMPLESTFSSGTFLAPLWSAEDCQHSFAGNGKY